MNLAKNSRPTDGFQVKPTHSHYQDRIAPKLQENENLHRDYPGQGRGPAPGKNGAPGKDGKSGQSKSCQINKKNNSDLTLTPAQKRNSPSEKDVYISKEDVIIRNRQAKYKMKNNGHNFDLPYSVSDRGRKKTPVTSENLQKFKDKIVEITLNGKKIQGTYRNEERRKVIHYFDPKTKRNVIYDAQTKEFLSAWQLAKKQVTDLLTNKHVGEY